jgi:hypothetical protein
MGDPAGDPSGDVAGDPPADRWLAVFVEPPHPATTAMTTKTRILRATPIITPL